MNEQIQQPVQEKKKKPKVLIITLVNFLAIILILIITLYIKKKEFLKLFLITIAIVLGIELVIFLIWKLSNLSASKAEKKNPFSLDKIEKITELFMWKKEGIARKQTYPFISEIRTIDTNTGGVQAYVWVFQDLSSVFKNKYFVACLMADPYNSISYREIDDVPDDDAINKLVRQIAKQPVESKVRKFTRTDNEGNTVSEETHEPVYGNDNQEKVTEKI